MDTKPFLSHMAPMPTDAPSKHDLRTKWRPAGSDANRNAAAAIGLAINQIPLKFNDISRAWMGFKTAVLNISIQIGVLLCISVIDF